MSGGFYKPIVKDLKALKMWESRWLLRFNPTKCSVMHLDFNDNPRSSYSINEVILEESIQEKDLGVITHNSLLWNEQIKASISKDNKLICWIVRNLITREKSSCGSWKLGDHFETGEPKVSTHTWGLIPPPCFIFEGCCFADGIMYLLVRRFRH